MKLLTKMEDHQTRATLFCCNKRRSLVSFATGTGKSLVQVATSILLLNKKYVNKSLLIATSNALIELKDGLEEHSDASFTILEDMDSIREFFESDEYSIGITKYTAILPENYHILWECVQKTDTAILCDEAHKMKSENSLIHECMSYIIPKTKYVIFSTATAITSKLDDLYFLINLLIPGYLGLKKDFDNKYKVRSLRTIYLKGGGKRKIYETVRYRNLECLQKIVNKVVVSFYPEYDIKSHIIRGDLQNLSDYMKAVGGVLEVKRRGRKQVESLDITDSEKDPKQHSVRMSDAQYVVNNDPVKIELFKKLIREKSDIGCVVFAYHHDTIILLSDTLKEMGIEHYKITGTVTRKRREKVKNIFREDSRNKVLLITTGGGQSLNLQTTNRIIFYDLPFTVGNFIQVLGRVVRYFSKFKQFEAYFLVMNETIDDYKMSYIDHNSEPIKKVLRNEMGSSLTTFSDYNDYILRKLRSRYLWYRTKGL